MGSGGNRVQEEAMETHCKGFYVRKKRDRMHANSNGSQLKGHQGQGYFSKGSCVRKNRDKGLEKL